MISSLKLRYSIFLEEPNKTCDSSNTSAPTTCIQPNLELSNSSSELSSSQSEPAKAADDPENGEREPHTPVSIQEEIGKDTLHTTRGTNFLKYKFDGGGKIWIFFLSFFFLKHK